MLVPCSSLGFYPIRNAQTLINLTPYFSDLKA